MVEYIKTVLERKARVVKKILAVIMLLAIVLPVLAGCKKDETYDPVPSTEEESRVIMTLSYGERSYEVKYELYRALFLNMKDEVSGGDDSVWTGSEKEEYIDRINGLIIERISDIYSVFAIADQLGIDLYSDGVDKQIKAYVKESVEGGDSVEGYGSYSKYLAALKQMNLNYSVQDLLLRYQIGLEKIETHYVGAFNSEAVSETVKFGDRTYTKDDILSYYLSDECVRTLRAEINPALYYEEDLLARIERVKSGMSAAAAGGEESVAIYIVGSGSSAQSEKDTEFILGRYSLHRLYFSEFIDAAFALREGGISEPIDVSTDSGRAVYIVYRAEKTALSFEESYADIVSVFLADMLGRIIYNANTELKANASFTETYSEIIHSEISMN